MFFSKQVRLFGFNFFVDELQIFIFTCQLLWPGSSSVQLIAEQQKACQSPAEGPASLCGEVLGQTCAFASQRVSACSPDSALAEMPRTSSVTF